MNFADLITLLKTAQTSSDINTRREEIASIIPSVRIMFDFDQQNRAHQYDLWNHCLHTVLGLPRGLEDDMLYLAALLHDMGKVDSQVSGEYKGVVNMHYYGHQEKSMKRVRDEIIPALIASGVELSAEEQRRLIYYVEYHDDRMSLKLHSLRRHLDIPVTLQEFQKLMLLQVADAKAHVQFPIIEHRINVCGQLAGEYGDELFRRIQAGE